MFHIPAHYTTAALRQLEMPGISSGHMRLDAFIPGQRVCVCVCVHMRLCPRHHVLLLFFLLDGIVVGCVICPIGILPSAKLASYAHHAVNTE